MSSDTTPDSAPATPPPDPVSADEARVLAVLLDEASPFEREAVAELLARRPDLRDYRDRTTALLGLLPAAAAPETAAGNPGLRLDESRRAALLEKIREPAAGVTLRFPSAAERKQSRVLPFINAVTTLGREWRMQTAIVVLLVGVIAILSNFYVVSKHTEPARRAEESFATAAGGEAGGENAEQFEHKLRENRDGIDPFGNSPAPATGNRTLDSAFRTNKSSTVVAGGASVAAPAAPAPSAANTYSSASVDLPGESESRAGSSEESVTYAQKTDARSRSIVPVDSTAKFVDADAGRPDSVATDGLSVRAKVDFESQAVFRGKEHSDENVQTKVVGEYALPGSVAKNDSDAFASGLQAGGMSAGSGGGEGVGIGIGKGGGKNFVSALGSRSVNPADKTEEASGVHDKVPVLGDQPLIGKLFQSNGKLSKAKAQTGRLEAAAGAKDASGLDDDDAPLPPAKKPASPPVLQTETPTAANAFSTFSLNVSDVSFRLAGEAVRRGAYPDSGGIRTEEFVNAQVYRDPMPRAGEAVALRQEQARHPFAHNRTLLRLSLKTAAEGRDAASPLNLVVLLDNSGSMERADRRETVAAAGAVLADNLRAGDKVSVIGFARDTRLLIDRMDGADTRPLRELAKNGVPAEGGTNLENALDAAYAQLARQTPAGGSGRVLLLTDGAANLGDADPARLAAIVETNRRQGRALDAFGIGFDGYNDTLLETLSRKGDGRYAYLNDAGEVRAELGQKLAGALRPFASDVKVQVEFNPARVNAWRLLGYDNHRLRKEDFRNNKVDAAELAAAESGTALYALELKPDGAGDIGVVRVRYRVPGTQDYKEREWPVVNTATPAFADAPEGIRLAGCAAFVAEALAGNPDAAGIDRAELRKELARLAAGRPDDPRLATLRLLAEKLAP